MTNRFHLYRQSDLQVNPMEDGCVVYQPGRDQVHFLNATAALVLELCDGLNDAQDIEALVAEAYGIIELKQNLTGEILERFTQEGIVYLETVTDEETQTSGC
jgi:hypothetical protein